MKTQKKCEFIRRIDSLGRIIIPKDVRNQLNIQEGDVVELSIMNNGVYFEKYQPLKTLESQCNQYLSVLAKNCRIACAICNTEYIIVSKGINLSTDLRLSEEIRKLITNLETYHYSENAPINLFCDGSYLIDTIQPIGNIEKPLGAVILLHYRNTTPEEKFCAKFIASQLTEIMNNQ